MHPSYYYGATACILVFDVTRKVTYQNLANWYKELREYCESIPCFLVANKIDVDMAVRVHPHNVFDVLEKEPRLADGSCPFIYEQVTSKKFKFAETHSLEFDFVSAADGTNVVKVFRDAVKAALKFKREGGDFMADVLDLLGEAESKE